MLGHPAPSVGVGSQHLLELRGQSTYRLHMSEWALFTLHSCVPEQFSDLLVSQWYRVDHVLIISPFMKSQ